MTTPTRRPTAPTRTPVTPATTDETDTTEESDLELCPNGEPQGHYTIKATDLTRVGSRERSNVTSTS